MIPLLLSTRPPSLTSKRLPPPNSPTCKSIALLQDEPAPLTITVLLLLTLEFPIVPWLSVTRAPLLTTSRLNEPLTPTSRGLSIFQRAVGLRRWTSLDLAVAFLPISLMPELVSKVLLESTSKVNEPFVPTVTPPDR